MSRHAIDNSDKKLPPLIFGGADDKFEENLLNSVEKVSF